MEIIPQTSGLLPVLIGIISADTDRGHEAQSVHCNEQGEIFEQGSHQEFLEKQGLYQHLYVSQFKGEAI